MRWIKAFLTFHFEEKFPIVVPWIPSHCSGNGGAVQDRNAGNEFYCANL